MYCRLVYTTLSTGTREETKTLFVLVTKPVLFLLRHVKICNL